MVQSLLESISYFFIFFVVSILPFFLSESFSVSTSNMSFFFNVILIMLIFLIFRQRKISIKKFFLFNKISLKLTSLSILLSICYNIASINILVILINSIFSTDTYNDLCKVSENIEILQTSVLGIINISVLVPIIEELFFRGLIFRKLNEGFNLFFSIFIQAVFFGIAHLNVFRSPNSFIFGLILGYTFYITKSIYVPIILHITINSFSHFADFIKLDYLVYNNYIFLLLTIFITFILIFIIKNKYNNKDLEFYNSI